MNNIEKEYNKNIGIRELYNNKIYQWCIFVLYLIIFLTLRILSPVNNNFLGEYVLQCDKFNIDVDKINLLIDIDNTLSYSYFLLLLCLLMLFFLLKYKIRLKISNLKTIVILLSLIIFSFLLSGLIILLPFSYMDQETIFLYFWIVNRIWIFSSFSLSYFFIYFIENLLDIQDTDKESCFIISFIIAISSISFFIDLNLIWAIIGLFLIFLTPQSLLLFIHTNIIEIIKNNKILFFIIFLIIGMMIGIYLHSDKVSYAAVLNIITKGRPRISPSFHFGMTRNTLPFNRGWFFRSSIQNQGFLSPWWRDTLTIVGFGTGAVGFGVAATDSPTIQKHMPAAKAWAKEQLVQAGTHLSSAHGLSQRFPPK